VAAGDPACQSNHAEIGRQGRLPPHPRQILASDFPGARDGKQGVLDAG
jgi:hypothetical protein